MIYAINISHLSLYNYLYFRKVVMYTLLSQLGVSFGGIVKKFLKNFYYVMDNQQKTFQNLLQ